MRALNSGSPAPYLRSELARYPLEVVAHALDLVCASAEQAEEGAREVLVGLVDLVADGSASELMEALRVQAATSHCLSLSRLLRRTTNTPSSAPQTGPGSGGPGGAKPTEGRVPDYTGGRTLSLGERKALARRPTRKSLEKLLADPHPAVIRALLANPKLVEDDVVRLAARRPALPAVLAEVARTTRWAHRVRVRMAIVLNPDTPVEVATPFLVLLTRPQLKEVFAAPYLSTALRSTARDLLVRRPPAHTPERGSVPPDKDA